MAVLEYGCTLDMALLEIYLEILTNFFEILHPPLITQWNYKTLIGCVNNSQKQPRFWFYKFLCNDELFSKFFPLSMLC